MCVQVPTEPHVRVSNERLPSFFAQVQLRASVIHTMPASALQIAVWKVRELNAAARLRG